jgi:hypothetical protein
MMITWLVTLVARETLRPTTSKLSKPKLRPVAMTLLLASLLSTLLSTTATAQDIFQRASFDSPQMVRLNLTTSTVNASDAFGQTPLMYAASNNPDPEVITVLVQTGADVNIRTPEGWTALMYAARDNNNPAVATRLLQFGADPTLVNSDGFTAADYAASNVNLRDVPMTAPIEMPMPDPASFNNPAAFMRPNSVPFVAAPYRSPFDGVSPEFIVPGEFAGAPIPVYQAPTATPAVTLIAPPTSAVEPYYPPAVAATPVPSTQVFMPPATFVPPMVPRVIPRTLPINTRANNRANNRVPVVPNSTPSVVPGFEGISPEFIVPGEFGMGFVPPALGQVNMMQTGVPVTTGQRRMLPAPSFVTPQPRLRSPIALSNAPVTPGRFAPNVPTYAGGSAANIPNRSAIGVGYERVPVRYSSSLLPDTARVIYGNVRYNPFLPLRDCNEFATQVSAQAFFLAAGGPLVDRHTLDSDGNGIACETLP